MKQIMRILAWFGQALLASPMTFPLETFFRAWFKNPSITDTSSNINQFAGVTTLASGSATVTVSTTNCRSDDLVLHSLQASSVSSGAVCVRSINHGNAIVFGWTDGASRAFDSKLMWWIVRGS